MKKTLFILKMSIFLMFFLIIIIFSKDVNAICVDFSVCQYNSQRNGTCYNNNCIICTGTNNSQVSRFQAGTCLPGTVAFGYPAPDTCSNSVTTLESYCDWLTGKCKTTTYPCDGGTPDFNMTCSGGVCSGCISGYEPVLASDPTKGCKPIVAPTCSGSSSLLTRFSPSNCTPPGGSKILSSCTNNNKNITMPYCAADGSCKYAYFICNDTISTGVYRNATCVPDSVNGAKCGCPSGYTAAYGSDNKMIGCAPPAAAPTCSGSDSSLLTRFSPSSCINSSGTFYSYCSGTVAYMRGCNVASGVCVVTPAYDCAPYNMTCGGSPAGYCNACKSGYTWVVDAAHPSSGCKPSSCTNYPGCDSSHPTNQTCTSETTYQSCMHRASDDCYVWFGQSCPTSTKYCLQSNTQLNIPNHPGYIYIQCVECLSDANCISPQLCNTTGAHNCYTPPSGQFCSDGTAYGSCNNSNLPKMCSLSGQLINNCSKCGCPFTGATACNSTGALNCYTPSAGCTNLPVSGKCTALSCVNNVCAYKDAVNNCCDGVTTDSSCSGKNAGNSCGTTPPTCKGRGESCTLTSDCCSYYLPPESPGYCLYSPTCSGICSYERLCYFSSSSPISCTGTPCEGHDGGTCNSAISLSDCTSSCNCYPAGCTCPAGCVRTGNIENASNCGGAGTCSSPILLGDCTTLCNCNPAGCTCPAGCVNPTAAFGSNCGGVAPSCNSRLALPNCTAICNCNPAGCTCPLSGCEKSGQNIPYNQNCAGDKCFTRWDWDHENSECCIEESQCLVSADGDLSNNGNVSAYFTDNKPKCINSGQFILDHYCLNGNWTTRTALIAGELLNFTYADAGRSSDFTLFCDDYTYALNYYEYLPVINYLSQRCFINSIEIPCLNDICVLRYKEGQSYKVIAATALNWNISNSTPFSFLNATGRSASYCNAVSGSDYAACSNSKDVWYNPAINAVAFSNTGFLLNPSFVDSLIAILRNPFGALINWINQHNMADQQWPIANFKKLYISSNAGKKVSAFISNNSQASNLFMHFQSFSTNLCSEVEKFVPGSCTKATKCDQMINSSVAQGQTNKLFDSWPKMTAELRINASFSQNHCNNCVKDFDENGIDCGGEDCPACKCADFDADGDGYLSNTYQSIGTSCLYGDCNDNDASIHPGVDESCNGIDDNCNGIIDEGCPTTLTMWVIKPKADEVLTAGASSYSIKWNLSSPMLANTFDAEFSMDNGLNYNNLAINIGKASACTGNTCTYPWSPVTSSKSSQAKIRITARNSTGAAVAAAESGTFTIGPLPQIALTITKPRAGDILNISAGNPINWSAAGLDIGQIQSYSLHYSTQENIGQSGDWSIIGYAQKGSSGYNWIIPNTFTPGQYYIMVKGLAADSSMLVYNISELISTSRWCSYYVGTCSVNPYAYGGGYVCSRTQYNITIPLAQQCPSDSGCTQNSNCP